MRWIILSRRPVWKDKGRYRVQQAEERGLDGSISLQAAVVPSLRHGQVVVMDNLCAHKGERVRELLERVGCELLYLPPYSPDFSPIEEAFSKVKGLLRKTEPGAEKC